MKEKSAYGGNYFNQIAPSPNSFYFVLDLIVKDKSITYFKTAQ